MTAFFCDTYSSIVSRYALIDRLRLYSLCRWLTRESANLLLPIHYKRTSSRPEYRLSPCAKSTGRVVVSISTFPARLDKLWLTLESLLRQTVKPDRIVVWMSSEQVASIDSLPLSLRRMQERGVELMLRPGDYRSHRKYYYLLTESPDDLLLTCDDDIFYHPRMIEQIMAAHSEHPADVIACYTHAIRRHADGSLHPYLQWHINAREGELFFGSGGGTLFPVGCFDPHVTDIELATRLCPTADDIWLNTMVRLRGTTIRHADFYQQVLPVLNRRTENLSTNNMRTSNDVQLAAIHDYFHIQ